MLKRRFIAMELLKTMDLLVFTGGFATALLLSTGGTSGLNSQSITALRLSILDFGFFSAALMVWQITFMASGGYQSHRLSGMWQEQLSCIKASTLGVLWLLLFSLGFKRPLHIGFFLELWIAAASFEMLSRVVLRILLTGLRHRGHNLRSLLIVGTNPRAMEFAERLERRRELGYRVAGFVEHKADPSRAPAKSSRVVCDLVGLPSFLRLNVIDEVSVCLTMQHDYEAVLAVAETCREQGIITRIHADLFDPRLRVERIDDFEGNRLLTVTPEPIVGWAAVGKVVLDSVLSFILILFLSPLFLATMLAIRFTVKGPIFFAQTRLGRNKRRFRMYKFRTMIVDAEEQQAQLEEQNEAGGPVFKLRNDPRVTPIGRILRKLSIDELPQLFNVLAGDMSLVGPRPLPIRDYEGFNRNAHCRRFSVRPGISGLWQISGRSELGFDQWMALDMKYIDQWSIWLDLKILAKTIPAVVKGAGAF